MVAEMVHQPASLPLLFEPDRPRAHGRAAQGWRRIWKKISGVPVGRLQRRFEDDEYGAQIQLAIVRYVLGGVRRPELARELAVSETNVQYMLRGATWGPYTRPVLRALRRLGISTGHGNWKDGARPREIIAASQTVMRRAIDALEATDIGPDARERLLADLYLLTVASGDDS